MKLMMQLVSLLLPQSVLVSFVLLVLQQHVYFHPYLTSAECHHTATLSLLNKPQSCFREPGGQIRFHSVYFPSCVSCSVFCDHPLASCKTNGSMSTHPQTRMPETVRVSECEWNLGSSLFKLTGLQSKCRLINISYWKIDTNKIRWKLGWKQ